MIFRQGEEEEEGKGGEERETKAGRFQDLTSLPFPLPFSLSPSRHIRRFASHLTEKSAECKVTPRSSDDEEKPSEGAGAEVWRGAAIEGVKDGSEWDLARRRQG